MRLIGLAIFLFAALAASAQCASDDERLKDFSRQLDTLRRLTAVPGMTAGIVKNQELLWVRGFGAADVEKKIPAGPDTPYRLASLTKTFTTFLVFNEIKKGALRLDDPLQKYAVDFPAPTVKIRHILTHTADDPPGDKYRYSGGRYFLLTKVLEKVSGTSFPQLLVDGIFKKAGMKNTVPGDDWTDPDDGLHVLAGKISGGELFSYGLTLGRAAGAYRVDNKFRPVPTSYGARNANASTGVISTVPDMAKYDALIDDCRLFEEDTLDKIFSPAISNQSRLLPYGFGWFVGEIDGYKVLWHHGRLPGAASALILKIPQRNLTLILLANSDGLSAPFGDGLGAGDVRASPFALEFLRLFLEDDFYGPLKNPEWRSRPKKFAARARWMARPGYDYSAEIAAHKALRDWRGSTKKKIAK